MEPERIVTLPARPESVADWEDLLLRLEIVPRVVRNTVDELVDEAEASRILGAATDRESRVGEWLERAAGIDRESRRLDGEEGLTSPTALARRFASLRARTFAMVQRRGLEVWEWSAPLDGPEVLTVHQLLQWLVYSDGRLLSDLREACRQGRVEC